jgi:hypothetical protein
MVGRGCGEVRATKTPVWRLLVVVVVVVLGCQHGCYARYLHPSLAGESEYIRTIRRLGDRMSRVS